MIPFPNSITEVLTRADVCQSVCVCVCVCVWVCDHLSPNELASLAHLVELRRDWFGQSLPEINLSVAILVQSIQKNIDLIVCDLDIDRLQQTFSLRDACADGNKKGEKEEDETE